MNKTLLNIGLALAAVLFTSASGATEELDESAQDEFEASDEGDYTEDAPEVDEQLEQEPLPVTEPEEDDPEAESAELGSYLDFSDDFDDLCFSDSSTDFVFRD